MKQDKFTTFLLVIVVILTMFIVIDKFYPVSKEQIKPENVIWYEQQIEEMRNNVIEYELKAEEKS